MNEIQSMNDTWQGGDTDMPPSLVGCGFWLTPPSSSRQGRLENLSQTWLILPTLTASRTRITESLMDLFRAERRAASVNEIDAAENVYELRRLTGFTWGPLADLLNVDRRTLHNWVKGGKIKKTNLEHIANTLSVLRFADRGSAEENEMEISKRSPLGSTPFEAIKAGQYSDARQYLSHGQSRSLFASTGISWMGEFRPISMHEGADGTEIIDPLPDEPKPVSRKRHIRRG